MPTRTTPSTKDMEITVDEFSFVLDEEEKAAVDQFVRDLATALHNQRGPFGLGPCALCLEDAEDLLPVIAAFGAEMLRYWEDEYGLATYWKGLFRR